MEKTNNLKLNVWEKSDPILVGDFNENNRKIDAAVGQIMAHAGNCKIVTGTYVGDGKYGRDNPTSITFPGKPLLVYIGNGYSMLGLNPMPVLPVFSAGGNNYYNCKAKWEGNTLTWYTDTSSLEIALSVENRTYYYIALLES